MFFLLFLRTKINAWTSDKTTLFFKLWNTLEFYQSTWMIVCTETMEITDSLCVIKCSKNAEKELQAVLTYWKYNTANKIVVKQTHA